MANVPVIISRSTTQRGGARPSSGAVTDFAPDPVNPPGTETGGGTSGPDTNKVSYNVADNKNATERAQARANISAVEEAPADSKLYGRKNASWEEITGGGGGSKWTDVGSDIFRNSRVLIGASSFSDSTSILEARGNLKIGTVGTGSSGTLLAERELILRQNGDAFGSTLLRLRNRNDEAGVIYENLNLPVVDFIFRIQGGTQRNFRLENRSTFAIAGTPCFHIGGPNPLNPTLGVGDSLVAFRDTINITFGTSTGTRIGTATNQRLSFWNKTPIVQPTTSISSATRVGGSGATITDTDTFGGYTVAQISQALINIGILA